jgi:uncharacterized protein
MKDFLTFIITPLLSVPDDLKIVIESGAVSIKVADADVGRIIGKQGNVINAIRILLKTYCAVRQLPPVNLTLETPPLAKKE